MHCGHVYSQNVSCLPVPLQCCKGNRIFAGSHLSKSMVTRHKSQDVKTCQPNFNHDHVHTSGTKSAAFLARSSHVKIPCRLLTLVIAGLNDLHSFKTWRKCRGSVDCYALVESSICYPSFPSRLPQVSEHLLASLQPLLLPHFP